MGLFDSRTYHYFDPAVVAIWKAIADGLNRQPEMISKLEQIERKIDTMSVETKAAWAEIDAETTRIAVAIEALVANSDDTELKTALTAHLSRLKGLGHNPDKPIPDPVPA